MSKLIPLVLLVSCVAVAATQLKAQSIQSLTLLGRADVAYRSSRSLSGNDEVLAVFDEVDEVALLPALELRYARSLGGPHGLRAGIGYSVVGWNVEQRELRWGCQFDGEKLDPTVECAEDADRLRGYRYHVVSVPVGYAYTLRALSERWSLALAAVVEPSWLRYAGVLYASGARTEPQFPPGRREGSFVVGVADSASLGYRLRESVAVRIEPAYRHHLSRLNDGDFRYR